MLVGSTMALGPDTCLLCPQALRARSFRQQFDAIVHDFFRDNMVRQDYLLSRGIRRS
jgi:hypothetical protein